MAVKPGVVSAPKTGMLQHVSVRVCFIFPINGPLLRVCHVAKCTAFTFDHLLHVYTWCPCMCMRDARSLFIDHIYGEHTTCVVHQTLGY